MRDLVKFLDAQAQEKVYTSFEDKIDVSVVSEKPLIKISTELRSYRDRVESYIRKNKHHITIRKLRSNEPITAGELQALETMLFDGEERGSKTDYVKEYGDQPLGVFIRSIVGLDIEAANQAFSAFLQAGNLRADQMTFVNNIITYLEKNGVIEPGMLFEPPFTDINDQGLLGVFDEPSAVRVISIIEQINQNAGVA
jgi:type I restriction enzyme R subunit